MLFVEGSRVGEVFFVRKVLMKKKIHSRDAIPNASRFHPSNVSLRAPKNSLTLASLNVRGKLFSCRRSLGSSEPATSAAPPRATSASKSHRSTVLNRSPTAASASGEGAPAAADSSSTSKFRGRGEGASSSSVAAGIATGAAVAAPAGRETRRRDAGGIASFFFFFNRASRRKEKVLTSLI